MGMHDDTELTARLLAAIDLLPADGSDLSVLLLTAGVRGLTEPVNQVGYDADLANYLRNNIDHDRLQFWHSALTSMYSDVPDATVISVIDKDYPANLLDCFDLPPVLFVRGNFSSADNWSVAIVGSRDASDSELEAADNLARAAAEANIPVVSGLATGVDTSAHESALSAGGRTLAVIGCGLDRLEHNLGLSDQISRSGAVLTPYRPGAPTTRSSLVARNAVISGLSLVSVLVAAGPQSGSFSEAEAAIRQGRKVLLWAPSLEAHRWAQMFVDSNPNAAFFEDPAELVEVMRQSSEAGGKDHEPAR
jgi:DNA processing protein